MMRYAKGNYNNDINNDDKSIDDGDEDFDGNKGCDHNDKIWIITMVITLMMKILMTLLMKILMITMVKAILMKMVRSIRMW